MDIIEIADMPHERKKAYDVINETISDLEECLAAMKVIEAQFAAGDKSFDFAKLREAIKTLHGRTEHRNFYLQIGAHCAAQIIENYVENVETPYVEEDEYLAQADRDFDSERDARFDD